MVFSKIGIISQKRVENITIYVKEFGTFDELLLTIDEMLGNLRFGVRADRFEKSLNDLAIALGFEGQRPDKEWKEGPDNLWGIKDNQYLLFECKNEVLVTRPEINKDETGQMNNASAWFQKNYPGAKVKRIMIIPTKRLSRAAGFTEDVEIMRVYHLKQLTRNVRAFYNEFRNLEFGSLSENKIQNFLDTHNLSVSDMLEKYSDPPKFY